MLLCPWRKTTSHHDVVKFPLKWLQHSLEIDWKTTLVKWRAWWLKANIYRQIFSISMPPRGLCGPLSRCSGSQMCLWPLNVYSWWYITFLFFSLGSGRKQGSDKLAWILHWSAQFHGCCRYTFYSLTHGLKYKSNTKHTVTQLIHLSKNYQMSLSFQTPLQMFNVGKTGLEGGQEWYLAKLLFPVCFK